MKNQKTLSEFLKKPEIKSFSTQFGIALDRLLWWKKEEEMGEEVLVLMFDNKERLTLRDAKQIQELLNFFS